MKTEDSDTILVTGASGVIGTALVNELKTAGREVEVIAVSSQDTDLTHLEAAVNLIASHRPKIIYHLAARVSGIMGNLVAQGQAYFDNVRINTHVIEAARLAGVRKVVAMGSAAIYSDQVSLPMREEDIWLGQPHGSESGYAHAKRSMLAQLQAYQHQYGLDYAYCVSTNLFGINDKFDEQFGHVLPSLISKFHRAMTEDLPVTVWGTGTPRRDFLYAKDAARAMRMIGESFSGPINLASGSSVSIKDVVDVLCGIVGPGVKVEWDRGKPDGQKLRDYDVSKLKALGFEPSHSFESALQETFDWYVKSWPHVRR